MNNEYQFSMKFTSGYGKQRQRQAAVPDWFKLQKRKEVEAISLSLSLSANDLNRASLILPYQLLPSVGRSVLLARQAKRRTACLSRFFTHVHITYRPAYSDDRAETARQAWNPSRAGTNMVPVGIGQYRLEPSGNTNRPQPTRREPSGCKWKHTLGVSALGIFIFQEVLHCPQTFTVLRPCPRLALSVSGEDRPPVLNRVAFLCVAIYEPSPPPCPRLVLN